MFHFLIGPTPLINFGTGNTHDPSADLVWFQFPSSQFFERETDCKQSIHSCIQEHRCVPSCTTMEPFLVLAFKSTPIFNISFLCNFQPRILHTLHLGVTGKSGADLEGEGWGARSNLLKNLSKNYKISKTGK